MIAFRTLQRTMLSAFILSCFIAWSVPTPLGFISPSDIILALGLVVLGYATLRNRLALPQPDRSRLWVCAGCFGLVTLSTLILSRGLSPSPVIKYAVFLLGLPLLLWIARAQGTQICALGCLRVIGNCGVVFTAWLTLALISNEGGPVSILGSPIYKNQLGHYLALIATSQFGLWALTGRFWRLMVFALALCLSLALDVRGPILAALLVASLLALRLFGREKAHLRRLTMIVFLVAALAGLLLASGQFSAQLARFIEPTVPEGGEISSTASRHLLWRYALAQIPEVLWFGHGHGGFVYTEGTGWMADLAQPHNNLLQIVLEGGVFGLGCFLWLLWLCLRPRPDQAGPKEGAFIVLRAIAMTYLATTLVDIIWVRGTGHLFWLIAFLLAIPPAPAHDQDTPPPPKQDRHDRAPPIAKTAIDVT